MLILASNSPRRSEILKKAHYDFIVIPADVDENIAADTPPHDAVMQIAHKKAAHIAQNHRDDVVLGADTIVCLGDEILGKPNDAAQARQMLRALSGNTHYVYTGYAIIAGDTSICGYQKTAVSFRALSDDEIDAYIASGEPMDKAGAYGMQDGACTFVTGIQGDYFNVVGLPICAVSLALKQFM